MKFLIEKRINVYENNDKRNVCGNVLIGNDIFIVNYNELIKWLVGPDGLLFFEAYILATLILLFKS
jgi:hypothetical protein